MIKKQSLAKNYIYQFLYQGLIVIIPLVLSPYLTRTLGSTSLGIYTYAHSISHYFVIAANLGIATHGKRLISRNSHDETALRKSFWSLFAVHSIISVLSAAVYIGYVLFFVKQDRLVYMIECGYVLSALFDITWLFYGLENFRSVVVRNTVVKIAECILIFLFVKTPGDTPEYTAIVMSGFLVGQAVMIPQAIRAVKPVRFGRQDVLQHIKPLLIFSVAVIASTLYTVFDKTLLGLMTTKENVAFYEYSNKIIHIPKIFIEIVSSVMFPRACKLFKEGKLQEMKKYMDLSFLATGFLGMAAMFGLLAVGKEFAVIYYGEEFSSCGGIIMAMSPLIYIVSAGKILREQCLIPGGKDKEYSICIVLNAIINLILSTALIPSLGVYGAVIGTAAAEVFGFIYQAVLSRKYMPIKDIVRSLVPFVVSGGAMLAVIKLIAGLLPDGIVGLGIEIVIGGAVYCTLSGACMLVFNKEITKSAIAGVRAKLGR